MAAARRRNIADNSTPLRRTGEVRAENTRGRLFTGIMPPVTLSIGRRAFLTGLATSVLAAGCRARTGGGPLVLRLSHSMAPGVTSLHTFADTFRTLAETATGGAVTIRVFPSGT